MGCTELEVLYNQEEVDQASTRHLFSYVRMQCDMFQVTVSSLS